MLLILCYQNKYSAFEARGTKLREGPPLKMGCRGVLRNLGYSSLKEVFGL
jgi:hypothetical protein